MMHLSIESILKESGTTALGKQGSITEWFIGLLLIIVFSFIYRNLYNNFSFGIGNRKAFSSNFILFSMAIYLIISSIKASLVLSLGLVGALSVVRFRNAIKDTEQIIYLLLLIALSLSIAANQYITGIITGTIGIIYIILFGVISAKSINTASLYAEFENSYELREIIQSLCKLDNTILSINYNKNSLIISATFNNYSDEELMEQINWLKLTSKEYRIASNQSV